MQSIATSHCMVIKIEGFFIYSRAGEKRRARILIPLGDLSHSGVLTNIAESKVVQVLCHGRWTFNGHGRYAHARGLNE